MIIPSRYIAATLFESVHFKGQHALGWETFHLTSAKHGISKLFEEKIDDWHFYRTPNISGVINKLPVLNQISVINNLTRRLDEVAKIVKPDILHAHSPVLNAIPAIRVGKRLGIPVVYEVRAFWKMPRPIMVLVRSGDCVIA